MHIVFEHTTKIRVRYGETDQMGYCYYGNYAQYFEVGRVEAMRELGMSYKSLEEMGVMLPVSEYQVKYKSPAYYDDELLVRTKIVLVKGARIYFEYEIENESGKRVADASTLLVFVNKETMSPMPAPTVFLEKIKPFEVQS
ncbi:MAG: acyl-CoA thioesterase [Bacteroidetes bacterium]|nr:MAG: acyl-CoA thioesterase [Bacteroidota bacterium]